MAPSHHWACFRESNAELGQQMIVFFPKFPLEVFGKFLQYAGILEAAF